MLNAEVINAASQFAYNGRPTSAEECKRGHINSTYFVSCESADGESYKYVLQAINTGVFKNPEHVMSNMVNVTKHIKRKLLETGEESRQKVIELIPLKTGGFIYRNGEGRVWRSYEYIVGENYQFAESPELLEFVGKAFGEFQMQLSDFDASKLYDTIPDFHNTPKRLADLELAVKKDECDRADSVREEIDFIFARRDKCSYIMDGIKCGSLPLRVTHNDTKLNNIMINGADSCVIDLDTVMPGSVLADFGDAIRYGASTGAEDERDLDKVFLRLDMFESFTKGFIDGLCGSLTPYEIESFPMGAYIITLELSMRFLEDYLKGDKYFRISYPDQNLARTRKHLKLALDMEEKMEDMKAIVKKYI